METPPKFKSNETPPQVRRQTWDDFRNCGLLWWTNRALHIFGWSIVISAEESTGKVLDVYPARVSYRGFSPEGEAAGFKKVTEWAAANAEELVQEANS